MAGFIPTTKSRIEKYACFWLFTCKASILDKRLANGNRPQTLRLVLERVRRRIPRYVVPLRLQRESQFIAQLGESRQR